MTISLGAGVARNRVFSAASMAALPSLVRADGAARLRRSAAPSADICRFTEIVSVKQNSRRWLSKGSPGGRQVLRLAITIGENKLPAFPATHSAVTLAKVLVLGHGIERVPAFLLRPVILPGPTFRQHRAKLLRHQRQHFSARKILDNVPAVHYDH